MNKIFQLNIPFFQFKLILVLTINYQLLYLYLTIYILLIFIFIYVLYLTIPSVIKVSKYHSHFLKLVHLYRSLF